MPLNTDLQKKVLVSQKLYKEWLAKTVLVNDCDHEYEGELDLNTREIKIKIYHDINLYASTVKEGEIKPQDLQFLQGSEKTVVIEKIRYTHWGETEFSHLMDDFNYDSIVKQKTINKIAQSAEKELAMWVATLPAKQTIDIVDIFKTSGINTDGVVDKDNIEKAFQVIVANIIKHNGNPEDFTLYVSEKIIHILQEKRLGYFDANKVFESGFIGKYLGLTIKQLEVAEITNRNDKSGLVEAEWGILKAKEGINYVVPYKTTKEYELDPNKFLLGGKGYQQVEYYDYFNLYPTRLFKIQFSYVKTKNAPEIKEKDILSIFNNK